MQWVASECSDASRGVVRAHDGSVAAVSLLSTADGDVRLLSAGPDGAIKIWSSAGGLLAQLLLHSDRVSALSPTDGIRVASSSWDGRCSLWDVAKQQELFHYDRGSMLTACDMKEHTVVTAGERDKTVILLDVRAAQPARTLPKLHTDTVSALRLGYQTARLFSSGYDCRIGVFDLRSDKWTIDIEDAHRLPVSAIDLTRDDRQLVSASWDKEIRLWDICTGQYRHEDSRHFLKGHSGSVSCLRVCADGKHLVTGGFDGVIYLWAFETMQRLKQFNCHRQWVTCLDLDANCKWLVSGSNTGHVSVWDVASFELVNS